MKRSVSRRTTTGRSARLSQSRTAGRRTSAAPPGSTTATTSPRRSARPSTTRSVKTFPKRNARQHTVKSVKKFRISCVEPHTRKNVKTFQAKAVRRNVSKFPRESVGRVRKLNATMFLKSPVSRFQTSSVGRWTLRRAGTWRRSSARSAGGTRRPCTPRPTSSAAIQSQGRSAGPSTWTSARRFPTATARRSTRKSAAMRRSAKLRMRKSAVNLNLHTAQPRPTARRRSSVRAIL